MRAILRLNQLECNNSALSEKCMIELYRIIEVLKDQMHKYIIWIEFLKEASSNGCYITAVKKYVTKNLEMLVAAWSVECGLDFRIHSWSSKSYSKNKGFYQKTFLKIIFNFERT